MLGFLIGVACMGLMPDKKDAPPAAVRAPAEPVRPATSATVLAGRPSLVAIEALFAAGEYRAVWQDDRTQVALWNTSTGQFSDFVEVTRRDGDYFFRDLARLTWPVSPERPEPGDTLLYAIPPSASARR